MLDCKDCQYNKGALTSLHSPCLECEEFSMFEPINKESIIDWIKNHNQHASKERIGLYPGSFDPPTLGHLDIIERAAKREDILYVAILVNPDKKPLFTTEEKIEMLKDMCKHLPNVRIISSELFLVDCVKEFKATAIYRGLRTVTDFEFEINMAHTNKTLDPDIETVFLATDLSLSIVSSSTAKIIAKSGKDVSKFVTQKVEAKLKEKFKC